MTGPKYIGMDVQRESISIAVRNDAGRIAVECVTETKANVSLDFIHGLRGELQVLRRRNLGHESRIELWSPNLTTVLLCWFRN
jgi:hypothetical protein